MRIGLNAQLLSLSDSYRGAGIAHYIHQTLVHLPRVGAHTYIAFVADRTFRADGMEVVPARLPTSRPPVRILWEQTFLPLELARRRVDLLHAMAFVTPVLAPVPSVVTVYDLSFALFPESFRPFNRWYLTTMTRRSVRKARAVIAISQNTANDLHRLWGVPRDRIHLAYCGVDDIFRPIPASEVAAFREARGLPARYILFVGTLEPRKNVVRLLEAYALLKRQGISHKLVVAGGKGWMYEPIFEAVERLGLGSDVLFPGFVPRQELPLWYNGADVFVYPSLYEGFGLGPLEAMACGTPVVVSDRASLPEVVGGAGLTVSPDDAPALAEAMGAILSDAALATRLRERGLRRAGEFTWERTAQATVRAYESVMSEMRHV